METMECAIHTTNQKIPPLTNPSLVRERKSEKSLKPISMASIVSTAGFISCGGLNRSSGRSTTTFGTQLAYPLSPSFGGGCSRRLKPAVVVVRAEAQPINPEIRKGEEKVVDTVLVPELSKPLTVYCRCWRSGTFPLCDGSHVKHNKATGDNVGPLLVKKQ